MSGKDACTTLSLLTSHQGPGPDSDLNSNLEMGACLVVMDFR